MKKKIKHKSESQKENAGYKTQNYDDHCCFLIGFCLFLEFRWLFGPAYSTIKSQLLINPPCE